MESGAVYAPPPFRVTRGLQLKNYSGATSFKIVFIPPKPYNPHCLDSEVIVSKIDNPAPEFIDSEWPFFR